MRTDFAMSGFLNIQIHVTTYIVHRFIIHSFKPPVTYVTFDSFIISEVT